ncbi:CotH kinase family protein [Desulfovibrio sp. UCD-KL4C]|uniref:CotH kinase family protein n=1 Tax=Desulfovibrio sp. UCD-KL4C TaxID=2578120 RepID=UPI0025C32446|nr:CotH kinase family protein [Desulfovibrio sp. UCD-KL4C]
MNKSGHSVIVFFLVIFFAATIILPHNVNAQDVVINEVFIDGGTKYPDWIELYNTSAAPVNLKNYCLSNKLDRKKWTIEFDLIINPHSYKLLYCDGKGKHDHTNFHLNGISGEVALFSPSNVVIDSLSYTDIPLFSSICRWPNGTGPFFVNKKPTKGIANQLGEHKLSLRAQADIKFSHPSGNYNQPFELEIYSPQNATLYYTTDGTLPDSSSLIYTTPIIIDKTTIIRVAAILDNTILGYIAQSFILNKETTLPVVSIIADPKFFWDEDLGIYTDGNNFKNLSGGNENWRNNKRRPVHIDYITQNGSWNVAGNIRIYGGASRGRLQKSFAIYVNDGPDKYGIKHQLFSGVKREKYSGIILRNGGDDWLWGQIRDGFQHILVENRVACDTLSYQPVIAFLNGQYWGLYGMRELPIKTNLLAKHKLPLQKVVILDGGVDIASKRGPFANISNIPAEGDYRKLLADMDIDSFLDYLIVEFYSGNTDWPSNNIKCWKAKSTKWNWILFDLDRGFNGKGSDPVDQDPFVSLLKNSKYNLMFKQLMANNKFARDFCARMVVHTLTTFKSERAIKILNAVADKVRPEMQSHINRWRWSWEFKRLFMSVDKWENNLDEIRDYCRKRPENILKFLDKHFLTGTTKNTEINITIKGKGTILAEGVKLDNGYLKGPVPQNIILNLTAVPAQGYFFKGWASNPEKSHLELKIKAGEIFKNCAVFELIKK